MPGLARRTFRRSRSIICWTNFGFFSRHLSGMDIDTARTWLFIFLDRSHIHMKPYWMQQCRSVPRWSSIISAIPSTTILPLQIPRSWHGCNSTDKEMNFNITRTPHNSIVRRLSVPSQHPPQQTGCRSKLVSSRGRLPPTDTISASRTVCRCLTAPRVRMATLPTVSILFDTITNLLILATLMCRDDRRRRCRHGVFEWWILLGQQWFSFSFWYNIWFPLFLFLFHLKR